MHFCETAGESMEDKVGLGQLWKLSFGPLTFGQFDFSPEKDRKEEKTSKKNSKKSEYKSNLV